jgi:hypothetical protein
MARSIEKNMEDLPNPSYLVLGFVSGVPMHVVASDDPSAKATAVITVYQPDVRRWNKGFRRRKQ